MPWLSQHRQTVNAQRRQIAELAAEILLLKRLDADRLDRLQLSIRSLQAQLATLRLASQANTEDTPQTALRDHLSSLQVEMQSENTDTSQ